MSKLLKLKKWLTLESSAEYLSATLEEPVKVADILQLALDRRITLSINLINYAEAKLRNTVDISQAKLLVFAHKEDGLLAIHAQSKAEQKPHILSDSEIPEAAKIALRRYLMGLDVTPEQEEGLLSLNKILCSHDSISIGTEGQRIPDTDLVIEVTEPETIQNIEGIWNLPMLGSERLDILHMLHHDILDGPEISISSLDGTWLESDDGKSWARLQDHYHTTDESQESDATEPKKTKHYHDADGLPEDATLVIRTSEIIRFVQSLSVQKNKPELSQREETTYLNIIGAMIKHFTSYSSIKQAGIQAALVDDFGHLPGISKSNLEKKFADANKSIVALTKDLDTL